MKIKVLLIMPNREVQTVKIPRNIKFIKALIGSQLFKIRINKNTIIIANKNADITEANRLFKSNIVCGTFIVVSIKNKRRVTMTKRNIRKYSNMFKLKRHQKSINQYRNQYLEEYYSNQKEMKQKCAEENKEIISKIA